MPLYYSNQPFEEEDDMARFSSEKIGIQREMGTLRHILKLGYKLQKEHKLLATNLHKSPNWDDIIEVRRFIKRYNNFRTLTQNYFLFHGPYYSSWKTHS